VQPVELSRVEQAVRKQSVEEILQFLGLLLGAGLQQLPLLVRERVVQFQFDFEETAVHEAEEFVLQEFKCVVSLLD